MGERGKEGERERERGRVEIKGRGRGVMRRREGVVAGGVWVFGKLRWRGEDRCYRVKWRRRRRRISTKIAEQEGINDG